MKKIILCLLVLMCVLGCGVKSTFLGEYEYVSPYDGDTTTLTVTSDSMTLTYVGGSETITDLEKTASASTILGDTVTYSGLCDGETVTISFLQFGDSITATFDEEFVFYKN